MLKNNLEITVLLHVSARA